jgi:hypothetical protein
MNNNLKILILILSILIFLCLSYIICSNITDKFINKYNICVLMWYDDKIKDYADKCYEINKKYCEKHGFDILKSDKRFYKDNREQTYEKAPLILEHLHRYDYIIWIDADAHFYLDSPGIYKFIKKYSNYNFILSGDIDADYIEDIKTRNINRQKTYIINAGVMIIKNSEYSKKVLRHWITSDELKNRANKKYKYLDQGIVRLYRNENINNFQQESIVLQYGVIQIFTIDKVNTKFYKDYPYLLKYKPYIIHHAGLSSQERLKLVNKYYKDHM